ncbi:MAG: MFS transporter [Planctomycetaceae bacterium]|nr:MFS transporter [Planctomycetaceae bacterium]
MHSDSRLPIFAPPLAPRRGLLGTLRHTTFRSLRHRNYRLYFFGQIVSFTGSWMQSAALMWLVYDATRNPLWPPLMLVGQVGPTLLFGPLGGALAARLPKRRLIFFTQLAFLVSTTVLAILIASDLATPLLLLAGAVANGLIQAIDLPARLAFVPDLVPRDDLINAVSLNSMLFNSARAVGPALAGLLFLLADAAVPLLPGSRAVTLGAVWCFGFNAVSYLAVLAALRRIDCPETCREKAAAGSGWDGVRYLIRNPTLGMLLVLTGAMCVYAWPALTLFPAYTDTVLHRAEKEYSVLVSALGAGALVAALVNATFGSVARRGTFLTAGTGFACLGLLGLAVADTLPLAFLAAAGLGFGLILFLSTGQSTLQLSVPDDVRGRVMALWAMTLSAGAPVGHLLAGLAARSYPIPDILLVLAAGVGACTVAAAALARAGLSSSPSPLGERG